MTNDQQKMIQEYVQPKNAQQGEGKTSKSLVFAGSLSGELNPQSWCVVGNFGEL